MSGNMRASYEPRRASSRRLESPFSWGFLGILLLALELLLPTCSALRYCHAPPKFQSMNTTLVFGSFISSGTAVEFVCYPGYQPIDSTKAIISVCQPDGTWIPAVKESCTIMSCPKLQEPSNGNLVYVNGTSTYGSQVEYVCDEGYHLVGTNILKCEASESAVHWSGDPPICEEIFCDPPMRMPYGDFTNSHKARFEYNETVVYTCNPSTEMDIYTLVGESTLVCIGPDEWSSEAPECKVRYSGLEESRNRADDLDGGDIAVVVLAIFVGVAVVGTSG